MNPWSRSLFWAMLVLLCWLPVPLGSNRPWAWWILEAGTYLIAALWLMAWLAGWIAPPVLLKRCVFPLILLGLWLLWSLMQWIPLPGSWVATLSPSAHAAWQTVPGEGHAWLTLSVDPYFTRVEWFKGLAYGLLFLLTLLLVDSQKRLAVLAMALVYLGTVEALYGSLMALADVDGWFFHLGDGHHVATGTFVNRNHLAGFLEIVLAIGIGLMIAYLDPRPAWNWRQRLRNLAELLLSRRARLRLMLVIMVIALVLTRSRMGNAAFFVSLLIVGGLVLAFSRDRTRSIMVFLISLVIIDVAVIGAWFGVDRVMERIGETRLEPGLGVADDNRDEVNRATLHMWRDFPWTGSGAGSFYGVFPAYRTREIGKFYHQAHNDYLQLGAESGLPGLLLLATLAIWSLIMAIQTLFRRRAPLLRGIAMGAAMGIISIGIHSMVDFNLHIPANAALFTVLLAFAWIARYHKETVS